MKRTHIVMIPFLCAMLVWVPLAVPSSHDSGPQFSIETDLEDVNLMSPSQTLNTQTGTLQPVQVEHTAATSGFHPYAIGRTDIESIPTSEVFLPTGAVGNSYSADCTGGYFLVGAGGSADFSSSQGTISLWIKWDITAPNGRFWGQHSDFETRWSGNRLVLDWGSDNTLFSLKTDWVPAQWYFIAIAWDDNSNYLATYWGDEETEPVEDASTTSWFGSVVGRHLENDIMSSRARPDYHVDGHIDEFRCYTIQRSLEDLRSDYRITLSGNEPGLAHYYEFEEDLTDSVGYADLIPIGSSSISQDVYAGEDGWVADQIEVDVRNLKYLRALNGSFENGNPGNNYDWDDDGAYYADGWLARRENLIDLGAQHASYTDTDRKYIDIRNEGYELNFPNRYRHYDGTSIYWYQIIDNSRQTDQFEFSMNYLYQSGPIGTNYSDNFEFRFDILNGTSVLWNWSIDPTNITQRDIWYGISPITIDIPGAPSTFEIRVSLNINTTLSYVEISEANLDLDGDSANGLFISLLIDDISLTVAQAPNLENVELSIDIAELSSIPIVGSSGEGIILLNYSYWEKVEIPFAFASNSSVSFEYSARISRMTRYSNSTFSTNLENVGVSYSVDPGQSVVFSLYTYIESYPETSDVGFILKYPSDWENPRVVNPFGLDITSVAIAETGQVEIPIGFADSVGWWEITLNGPNYAASVLTQVQTPSDLTWNIESTFNSGNRIRCRAIIGTGSENLPNVTDVAINWYDQSGGIWQSEVISNPNSSIVISQETTLSPNNASIGEWMVSVSWSNGTEVAYGFVTFELYHRLTVFTNTPNIMIESGDGFTAAIYLYDQDNGNPIMSDADVIGNWSANEVQFNPNLAKGWWEADFNTTELGTGDFVIVVSVSIPFYEPSSTIINIQVPNPESFFAITLRAGLVGALVVFISIAAITLSRRFYMTATAKRNLELLALEGRKEDAKNLIGLLVIHRSIGLPVYSNILKGGFQEALLSSFISAISHFRSEFSMAEPTWTAIPITEVITVVQTDALICAIITVDSASTRQKEQLEAFGREVGGLYDHEDDTMRTMARSPTLTDTFDDIFESYFDGALMKRYVGVKKNLPKHLHAVSDALDKMEIYHGVTVEAIIKETSILGYSERRAYRMVLEAVDDGYLIAAVKKLSLPFKTED